MIDQRRHLRPLFRHGGWYLHIMRSMKKSYYCLLPFFVGYCGGYGAFCLLGSKEASGPASSGKGSEQDC